MSHLRQDELGDAIRFDNRDLVAHGGHPRQVRPVFLGSRGPFFFSTTSMVTLVRPPVPAAQVAQLTEDDSEQGTQGVRSRNLSCPPV